MSKVIFGRGLSVILLAIYGLNSLILTWLYRQHQGEASIKRASDPAEPGADVPYPHVTIQLPVYNERHVVERLLEAAINLDWPAERLQIKKTIPCFADPSVGCVQTQWGHVNPDTSQLTKAQSLGIDGHFVVEQSARHAIKAFLNFNGTAGVWRRALHGRRRRLAGRHTDRGPGFEQPCPVV